MYIITRVTLPACLLLLLLLQVPLKGITVLVDGQPAKVVDVPYATRQLPTAGAAAASSTAAANDSLQDRAAAAK
jgi:hypothetical protein